MPLHDAHYQHWDGVHQGIWTRRWVIARHGLAFCVQNKFMRNLIGLCWLMGLMMAGMLFLVGQLLVADSVVVKWVAQLNPALQAFAGMLTAWLVAHPEISVATTQNLLFYLFCVYSTPLSVFALGVAMPALITRDLASNAMVIYASKAVTRGDYLLGKFCVAFGLLTMTWLGPVAGGWLLGNLLAPDWGFFWHARAALGHGLLFGLISMLILSALALGVSAISRREKSTPALWFMWWVLGGVIQPIAVQTRPWLRHLSFSYDLRQIALAIFRLGDDLKTAQDNIPILGEMLRGIRPQTRAALEHPEMGAAVVALALMLAAAGWIVFKRVAPE
jgi:ABC-2 type transport system permease protein